MIDGHDPEASALEPDARDLCEGVDMLVRHLGRLSSLMQMEHSDAAKGRLADEFLVNLFRSQEAGHLPEVVGQRDGLAATLNRLSPNQEPILSMSTLRPAGYLSPDTGDTS